MPHNFDEIIDRKNKFSMKWSEMTNSYGTNDLIPLWVADMDFKTASPIVEAVKDFAEHGIYGYAYRPDSYYESISKWIKNKFDWEVKTEELLFSPGVMCSMNFFIQELSNEGDHIVIQEPVYYPFASKIVENKRNVLSNHLTKDEDGNHIMDLVDLENKFKEFNPPIFILCNPHNPVGRCWTRDELILIGDLCLKYNVKIISDEIHADLVYKPNKHIPIASIKEEYEQNIITLMAPSKTFNLAGLQTSYVVCKNKKDLEILYHNLAKIDLKRNNNFGLVATEAAYNQGEEWLNDLVNYLEGNIDYVIDFFKEYFPKVIIKKPEATYLVWIDFSALDYSEEELFNLMIEKAKVALTKGSVFGPGGEGYLRMNIACPRSTIERALNQIKEALL